MKGSRSLVIAAAFAWGASAHAQSDRELATRQELITQAGALSDQGKHAEALALAKRASAIKMTPSLRLFLAGEELSLGLLADAYGNGRQCAAEAEADMGLHERDRILSACKELETSLGKRVGRVTVNLPTPVPPNVRVTVSSEEINAALVGTPYVVSPGKLTIVVTATGYLPFTSDLEIAEGGSADVDVHLAPDPNAQPCPDGQERLHGACAAVCTNGKVRTTDEAAQCCWPGQTWSAATSACTGVPQCSGGLVAQGAECVAAPTAIANGPAPTASNRLLWPLMVGGAGVVGLGVGSVFGLMASSSWSTAKSECPTSTGCSAQAMNAHSNTTTFATVSTVAFISGGVLLAGGITLYVIAPKDHSPAVGLQVAPRGLGVVGRF